jgi:hypothetical protein
MLTKKIIKEGLNDRLKLIDDIVDEMKPIDSITSIIKPYKFELEGYKYIDSVDIFSTLKARGTMKYISRYDKKLRSGGLLIKIYMKEGKWIAILKQFSNKKYYIRFDSNYIFYLETKSDAIRDISECFMSNLENGLYEIV